ncbi:MAG: AMP-binding protein [Pelosinus sp.]|nr:AMP-binding protein [Pelosinus sp.]
MKKTPLEAWIAERIGAEDTAFFAVSLQKYQLQQLQQTIMWAFERSSFYHRLFKDFPVKEFSLAEFQRLPFTYAEDIRLNPLQFLCVSQDSISRVVTLDSSGTTGLAKRLYFTPAEQEITISFFQYGMASLVKQGERVIILFPGQAPGSLSSLLAEALGRLGVTAILHGAVSSIPLALQKIIAERVDSIVGMPSQVLALARYGEAAGLKLSIKSVLLSADYVPKAIIKELARIWGSLVITHYGMTEMGLGGGTECVMQAGYHLHEADFYFEIVNPLTGNIVPDGEAGEVVITTLTRRGMPLIRYRTGDISSFLSEPCPCGARLKRLAKIKRRKNSEICVGSGLTFTLADLDEIIFALPGVIHFSAGVDNTKKATRLRVIISMLKPNQIAVGAVYQALQKVPAIGEASKSEQLLVDIQLTGAAEMCLGTAKRMILGS